MATTGEIPVKKPRDGIFTVRELLGPLPHHIVGKVYVDIHDMGRHIVFKDLIDACVKEEVKIWEMDPIDTAQVLIQVRLFRTAYKFSLSRKRDSK